MSLKKRVLLIDSANIYHNQKYEWIAGRVDNIIEPFLQEIQKLIFVLNPSMIILMNDEYKSRYRSELVKDYKSGRIKAQRKFTNKQIEAEKLVSSLKSNLKKFEGLFIYGGIPNVEADDVIGMLYNDSRLENFEFIAVSQDKDLSTVVSHQNIYDWKKQRYKTKEDMLNFTRNEWLLFQALMGDSVDSFSGVKGVGEKTAEKIVRRYGSVNNLLVNAYKDSIHETDSYVRKGLERIAFPEGREELKLGYMLAKIMRDTSLLNEQEKDLYEALVSKVLNYKKPKELVSDELDEYFLEQRAFEGTRLINEIGEWL